ncbi:hypothetical protein N9O57_02240 [bacterium]|nr:hypothetical protein [bacterium]
MNKSTFFIYLVLGAISLSSSAFAARLVWPEVGTQEDLVVVARPLSFITLSIIDPNKKQVRVLCQDQTSPKGVFTCRPDMSGLPFQKYQLTIIESAEQSEFIDDHDSGDAINSNHTLKYLNVPSSLEERIEDLKKHQKHMKYIKNLNFYDHLQLKTLEPIKLYKFKHTPTKPVGIYIERERN